MSLIIKLAQPEAGETVHAGIEFIDGVATVEALGANKARYFEIIGASITQDDIGAPATLEALQEMSIPQMRSFANRAGVELPPGNKAALVAALAAILFPDSTDDSTGGGESGEDEQD